MKKFVVSTALSLVVVVSAIQLDAQAAAGGPEASAETFVDLLAKGGTSPRLSRGSMRP